MVSAVAMLLQCIDHMVKGRYPLQSWGMCTPEDIVQPHAEYTGRQVKSAVTPRRVIW